MCVTGSSVLWHNRVEFTGTILPRCIFLWQIRGEDVSHRAESEVSNLWEIFFLYLLFFIYNIYIYIYNIYTTHSWIAQLDYPSCGKEMFGNGLPQGAAIALRKGHSQTVLLGHDVVWESKMRSKVTVDLPCFYLHWIESAQIHSGLGRSEPLEVQGASWTSGCS